MPVALAAFGFLPCLQGFVPFFPGERCRSVELNHTNGDLPVSIFTETALLESESEDCGWQWQVRTEHLSGVHGPGCKVWQSMFRLRHAYVALKSLKDPNEALLGQVVDLLRRDSPALRLHRKSKKFRKNILEECMALLKDERLISHLYAAQTCVLTVQTENGLGRLAETFSPQRQRVSGGRILLSNGQYLPLVGLGTGFSDCYRGKTVEADGNLLEEDCNTPQPTYYTEVLEKLPIRLMDTAFIYGSEANIMSGVAQSKVKRRDVFITTKTEPEIPENGSWSFVNRSEASLRSRAALFGGYVDLYLQHHRSVTGQFWDDLVKLKEAGLARALGLSFCVNDDINVALRRGPNRSLNVIQTNLSPCTMVLCSAGIRAMRSHGATLQGFGLHNTCGDDPLVRYIAKGKNVSTTQLIGRWANQLGIPYLSQSENIDHLRSNIDTRFSLSDSEMQILGSLQRFYDMSRVSQKVLDVADDVFSLGTVHSNRTKRRNGTRGLLAL